MILEILLLCIAPMIGLIVGLIPSIGVLITMITFFPLLIDISPNIAIIFYAMMLVATQFSGSVSAIWLGLLGESSNLPVLRERENILKFNLQFISLKYTSYSSIIATVISFIIMCIFFAYSIQFNWLLRTELKILVIFVIILFCIIWPYNNWKFNIILFLFGLILGTIGYDDFTNLNFLTFNNVYLYGGLPNICVLLGLYATPTLIKLMLEIYNSNISNNIFDQTNQNKLLLNNNKTSFPIASSIRGSLIGFIIGLIPMIGTTICSNLAYLIEIKLSKNKDKNDTLNKICSAEAANNSAVISVLIPLIILGLPIQPSEIVLYEIININNWNTSFIDINFIILLCTMLTGTTIICHLFCYKFANFLLSTFVYQYKYIIGSGLILILCSTYYTGFQSDQSLYFMLVYLVMLVIGLILIRFVDLIPVLMGFLLQTHIFSSFVSFGYKYFN